MEESSGQRLTTFTGTGAADREDEGPDDRPERTAKQPSIRPDLTLGPGDQDLAIRRALGRLR
jgi:hypothetical protein